MPTTFLFATMCLLLGGLCNLNLLGQTTGETEHVEYKTESDVLYRNEEDASDYAKERCRLDVYYPSTKGFSTIVWFHGGGLKGGNRFVPDALERVLKLR